MNESLCILMYNIFLGYLSYGYLMYDFNTLILKAYFIRLKFLALKLILYEHNRVQSVKLSKIISNNLENITISKNRVEHCNT